MSETPPLDAPTTSDTPKPVVQKRRFNYTLAYKMEVIKWAESTNNCQASTRFGVPRQCIQSWRKMKNELLLEEIQGKSGKKKRLGGGGRPLKNVEVDEKLEEWLKEKQADGVKITGKMIKEYAMTISENEDFKASNGWLQRFMIRHGLATPTRNQKTSASESSSGGFEDLLNQLLQQSEGINEIIGVGGVEEEAGPPMDMGAELHKLLENFRDN
ncbi:hypothetical protein CRE_02626 [Caenorhabditis remanei]|uniref:HTH CENPB-type domain-containing protein n=1 Tax=Caenorhabditis remanei TaxID=31234 RepID=E3NDD0_CAERE|nr:hypothetical protein CRE_02626 [Caenorhabditis remanei]